MERGGLVSAGLSVRSALRGRRILLLGSTGFVGKAWLVHALTELPEIGKITLVIRRHRQTTGEARFRDLLASNPAFRPLHESRGGDLGAWLASRVEVVEGDVRKPGLGFDEATLARLRREIDVVINSAAMIDFVPRLDRALATNVKGGMEVARFAAACDHASLLHVSTCYVAGNRSGTFPEAPLEDRTPSGEPLDLEAEGASLLAGATRAASEGPQATTRWIQEGTTRAERLGWPNVYTYTKSLAEGLLTRFAASSGLRMSLVRPGIVETAREMPFEGYNDGLNLLAAMVYVLGTWVRHLPATPENPLDVVPVDDVARALSSVAAALVEGRARPVYQVATSERNPLTVGEAFEYIALSHRSHYRRPGAPWFEREVMARWDGVTDSGGHLLGVHSVRRAAGRIQGFLGEASTALKSPSWLSPVLATVKRGERRLSDVERLVDLATPFMRDNRWIFVARALDELAVQEPELRFEPEGIDWPRYWLDVHLPALRRWCFPRIEKSDPRRIHVTVPFEGRRS
jgi:long-chain acyl-CoA synthetase